MEQLISTVVFIVVLLIGLAIPFGIAAGIGYLFGRTRRSALIGALVLAFLIATIWVIRLADMIRF